MEHDAGTADLAEGAMRTVELDGEEVLLVQSGGRCHAVGAKCPHAGGPLVQGALHDGTVLCPWHKAAFRLADGALLEPPAVDDLPAWSVRTEDGRYRLTRQERAPTALLEDSRVMAIIGTGAAGTAAAQALRRKGFGGRVVLIGTEARLPYDRTVLSKYALSGTKGGEKDPLHAAAWYGEHRIERRVARVTELDAAARRITCADGGTLAYDAALLASGGTPRPLEVPGGDLDGVCVLRSPDDVPKILAAAEGAAHAVVAGTGFIGMEAAAHLRQRGLAVTVVSPEGVPFEKKLGPQVGGAFQRVHEAEGITFELGTEVTAVEGEGRVRSVRLKDGRTLPAELVVVGLGVVPNTGMLRGVELRKDHGVTADASLRIADGLYAAGDIAAFPHRGDGEAIRVEHWRVAEQHGQVAARGMLGQDARYDAVPYFWTIHFKKRLDYVGHAETWDDVVIDGDLEKPEFTAFYVQGGTVAAVAGWGRDQAMARTIGLMTDRRDWTVAALQSALAARQ